VQLAIFEEVSNHQLGTLDAAAQALFRLDADRARRRDEPLCPL
jgi:hypothetical protein